MAENQQGGGAPDEGQTPAKGKKKPYRQTVLKIQTDKSLQRREARGELSNDPGGKD